VGPCSAAWRTGSRHDRGEQATRGCRRRLTGNYRNPGPSQQTSLRINALLREHLAAGGTVELAVTTTVTVWLSGVEQAPDLNRKSGRLLAETRPWSSRKPPTTPRS
jgi:hypothetical protein